MSRVLGTLTLLFVLIVGLPACGGTDEPGDAQPVPDATRFESGAFDELPRLPRSDQAGPVGREEQAVTQSFLAEGVTPAGVLDFYETHLEADGWRPAAPPSSSSTGIWRGDWIRADRRVEVIAQPLPGRTEEDDELVTQYSLVLNDDTEDNPVFTASSVPPGSLDQD